MTKFYVTTRKGKRQVTGAGAFAVGVGVFLGLVLVPLILIGAYMLPVLLLTDASFGAAFAVSIISNILATCGFRVAINQKGK